MKRKSRVFDHVVCTMCEDLILKNFNTLYVCIMHSVIECGEED